MTQDVALPSQQGPTEVGIAQPPPAGQQGDLVQWAYEARQAHLIAKSLVESSFVPDSLRKRPNDVAIAILAGHEMGLLPMATLRSIDVIHGNPALRATAMRGLLQSRGHSIQLVESTDERCVMQGKRKGEDRWQQVEWTLDRARQLGLVGKDQWKKQPRTMLIARATGEICRLIASDLLQAMPYNAEETADEYDEAPRTRGATAAELAGQGVSPPPESPVSGSSTASTSPAETPASASAEAASPSPSEPRQRTPAREKPALKSQLTKIHILAGELGLSTKEGEREEFDAMVNAAAARTEGHEVATTKDLNQQEAGWVIEAFQKRVEAAPKTSETTQDEADPSEPVDAELVEDAPTRADVPGGDREYWDRLVWGAKQRGLTEGQIRAGLLQHYGQPLEDLEKGQVQAFTTKVALGTAKVPSIEELDQ